MSDEEAIGAATAIVVVVYLIAALVGYLVASVLLHFTFRKVGIASWRAWVPFANYAAVLQTGGYSGWWAAGMLVPGLNLVTLVFMCISYYRLGKGLKMDDAVNILGIVVGFWCIVALVTRHPFDHRITGVRTRQPEQLAAIARGGLVDPVAGPAGYGYARAPQSGPPPQWGPPPQPGQPQNPWSQRNPYGQDPYGGPNPHGQG